MDRDTVEPSLSSFPGRKAEQRVDYHRPFAAPSPTAHEFVWDLTEDAIGPFCTDINGNILLDFTSHIVAMPLGYNNPTVEAKLDEFNFPNSTKIAGSCRCSSS